METGMENHQRPLTLDHVLDLYTLYNGLIKDELGFFLQSFHFYISLLSAILAVTLTGLLNIEFGDSRDLVLLLGPLLLVILSRIGYNNAQAFYRRFTEAWVAKLNLESMLNLAEGSSVEIGIREPVYKSGKGGFIPQIEWRPLKEVFEEAEKNKWDAEKLANKLVTIGTTLSDAKWTFMLFSGAGIVIATIIVIIVVQ
jgi:hypothetical protein